MKYLKSPILAILAGLVVSFCTAGAKADAIAWERSWNNAQSLAQASGKPIMIDFYTDWCGWCKKLDRTTYSDSTVVEFSEKFIPLKLDAERGGRAVARRYEVDGFPSIVFVEPDGTVIHRVAGYLPARPYYLHMQYALGTYVYRHRPPATPPRVSTDTNESARAANATPAEQAPSARAYPAVAPPQPIGSWSSIRSTQESRDTQARLDAAAALSPNGAVLDESGIDGDPDAALLVADGPVVARPVKKASTKPKGKAVAGKSGKTAARKRR